MASNINPSLTPVNNLANFRFWCQKVLPLVYDDSLSYYEVLGKMVVQLNDVIDNVNADTDNVLTLKDAFLELQTYVNNFFDDIDQLASYAERAEAAQTAANTSAVNAASSASNASASSLAAMDARDAAVAARQAAQTSANNASTAAINANTKANEATQSAITAQTAQASASQSATLAATDRSAAQTAVSTATTKANEANTSATNAETSAENAAQSESNAEELVNKIQENLDNIQQNTQDISELKESISDIENRVFEVSEETYSKSNEVIVGTSIPASTKQVITEVAEGQKYKIEVTGSTDVIPSDANITFYTFDENNNRELLSYNRHINTIYEYTASKNISAFSMLTPSSAALSNGTVEFNLTVITEHENSLEETIRDSLTYSDDCTVQVLTNNLIEGAIDPSTGAEFRTNQRIRTQKYIYCKAGTIITCPSYNFNVFEYEIVDKNYIRSNGPWTKSYTTVNDAAIKIMWQTTVENIQTIINDTTFTPKPYLLADHLLPIDLVESLSKESTRYAIQSTTVKSIAHRGNYLRGRGMECGASAVIAAKRYGYKYTENDIQLTSDNKMVMWHDTTLQKIGDGSHTIADYTLAELKAMDFGSSFGFPGEKILTFSEWLTLCKELGINCYIDFKATLTTELLTELVDTIRNLGMLNNVTYLAYFSQIRALQPNARLAYLNAPTAENISTYAEYLNSGEFVFNPSNTAITAETANLALKNGFGLECFFVDFESQGFTTKALIMDEIGRLINLGVQGITIDIYRVEDFADFKYNLI